MPDDNLRAYLNDHLAGSVAAVEMVERAVAENEGTEVAAVLRGILSEIRDDQDFLRAVLDRAGGSENPLKKAGAWLAEKAGRLKLHDVAESPLDRLEMLETLALGIHGKLGLWRALEQAAPRHAALAGVDFANLARRAQAQRERVEELRLAAAAAAF